MERGLSPEGRLGGLLCAWPSVPTPWPRGVPANSLPHFISFLWCTGEWGGQGCPDRKKLLIQILCLLHNFLVGEMDLIYGFVFSKCLQSGKVFMKAPHIFFNQEGN